MMHAYQEMYLNKAQSILGSAFDYAINSCDFSLKDFINLFLVSSVCEKLENGEAEYLVGKSGIELVVEIVEELLGETLEIDQNDNFSRSKEYWIGWAIAYYHWQKNRKYSDIFKVVSIDELKKMYYTLHEADILKFVEILDERFKEFFTDTKLKRIRTTFGCTQKQLSEISGVSLRSIQMYEQRQKDINKASLETVYSLSKALGCKMEDLIEI